MREAALPTVLLIGFSSAFFWERRDAIGRAGGVAVDAPLTQVSSLAIEWAPSVMVLTEDLYAFDPSRFDALADVAGAKIALLRDEEEGEEEITQRVAAALSDSVENRSREVERPTTPVPGNISEVRRPDRSAVTQPARRHG